MKREARSVDRKPYRTSTDTTAEDECIARALRILQDRVKRGRIMDSPKAVTDWLRLELGELEREVFGLLALDCHNRLIARHDLFWGSVDRSAVYTREVLKACLADNAAACILYHNHPSGVAEPSGSDEILTRRLMTFLEEIDVRLHDHIVVSAEGSTSMRERGII